MKKIITVVGIIIVLMSLILISGCTERDDGATPEPAETATSTASPQTVTETPEPTVTESNATGSDTVGSLSQEDLDRLKEDLEDLEYEDLDEFAGE